MMRRAFNRGTAGQFACAQVLALLLLVTLTACQRETAGPAGAAGGAPAPPVKVVRVAPRDLPVYREFVGQTRGRQDVDVRARVQGYLQQIHFRQGSDVKEGDLLFTLDRRPYEAELAQARAAEAQLRSEHQQALNDARRYEELTKTGVIARQQAEQASSKARATGAAVKAQEAVVKAREVDLTFTEIRAPIAGRISLTPYSVGDLVGTGAASERPLATISDLSSVRVRFSISETDYLRYIRSRPQGTTGTDDIGALQLTLADGSVYPHPGRIATADNAIDPATGTLTVEAEFPNPERLLRTGQYAKIRVGARTLRNVIAIPARAVQEQQGITSVRVVDENNRVESRRVEIGERSGNLWAVTSGLSPGERIVVEGLTKATPGSVVSPEEVSPGSPESSGSPEEVPPGTAP